MTAKQVSATEFKAKCLCLIRKMEKDGHPLTITRRGRPVAVLSPLPAPDDSPFIGMMRGTVLAFEDPFSPAASPSEWAALSNEPSRQS